MFCRRMYHFLHLAARVNLGGTPLRYSKGRADQICRTRSLHKTKKGTFIHDERPLCRGDKTPLELFVAGVRGWEAAVRRRMTGEMPAK
jgi:hypothetical protein